MSTYEILSTYEMAGIYSVNSDGCWKKAWFSFQPSKFDWPEEKKDAGLIKLCLSFRGHLGQIQTFKNHGGKIKSLFFSNIPLGVSG